MIELIGAGGERLHLIASHQVVDDETPLEFLDERDAFRFLIELAERHFNRAALRRMVEEDGLVFDPHRISDEHLLKYFAFHLISGRLRVVQRGGWERVSTAGGRATGTPGESAAEEEEEAAPPPESDELTWIKFEVVYDETGDPVKGVTLKVKLPDGSIRNATTDASGMIEFRDILHGTCDIERMIDSDTLEVVAVL
ncbi:MAG: hypothetical protein ACYTG0_45705 [Planctomycetota bacterium]|jgi:hypothetical protein